MLHLPHAQVLLFTTYSDCLNIEVNYLQFEALVTHRGSMV